VAGIAPSIDILTHGLPDESRVYRIESVVIDLFSRDGVSNEIQGNRAGYTVANLRQDQVGIRECRRLNENDAEAHPNTGTTRFEATFIVI
jgi:hypothetical protein